ncbi:tetratricopeptide repeat protein, partial [Phormidium sp. CCY1219]|uniref:tetratricopeptide repeat protein n=1 Tax=Phormidium sp. CCY1219 TaxID=2886104 RepID=UPI003FA79065
MEEAIRCTQAALEVYTRSAFPYEWATTQNNLAIAYNNRIRGEQADNIEEAIRCTQAALEVYTRSAFPY